MIGYADYIKPIAFIGDDSNSPAKNALIATIAQANALNPYDWSIASWEDVEEALTDAITALNDPASTDADYETAALALNQSIDALVPFDIRQINGVKVFAPYNNGSTLRGGAGTGVVLPGIGQTVSVALDLSQNLELSSTNLVIENPLLSNLYSPTGLITDYSGSDGFNWIAMPEGSMTSGTVQDIAMYRLLPGPYKYEFIIEMVGDDIPPSIGNTPTNDFSLYHTTNLNSGNSDLAIEKIAPNLYTVKVTCAGGHNYPTNAVVLILRRNSNQLSARAFRVRGHKANPILGNHLTQPTASSRPTWNGSYIVYDGVDDNLISKFDSDVGENCTVVRCETDGNVRVDEVNIGNSYSDNVTSCGICIIDRALDADELPRTTRFMENLAP